MNKCRNCDVLVYDDTGVCPLCHSVLDEMTEEETEDLSEFIGKGAPYPDVRKRTKRLYFVMRLILFLFILAEISLLVINHFTTPNFWWSGISGVAMIYIYISMVYWIHHDAGYAAKIGLQLILTMLLLFGIDYFTGMTGWALQWAIPGVILFGDAIVFFLMMLNRQHWYSYTLLLLLIALCSVGIISLYFAGRIANVVLPVICAGVTGVYLLGTIIFGDREMARELKRRFHM
ncbi:MAG: hypothetical protein K2K56_03310 [Lachnospiraceae bacterium]|nr:hypothetical protein [Lachnospiraceae bacterium]MDE6625384.1 hypothetical protein [Lachnospiraceae bacterium]